MRLPRILIIPHQPHRGVRVRALEMARYLAGTGAYEVYVLTWETASPVAGSGLQKLQVRGQEAWRSLRQEISIEREGALQWVRIPHLLTPWPLCQMFNQEQLRRFCQQHHIDVVLSANAYHFPVPAAEDRLYYYDVVDDHLTPESGPVWRRTRPFTLTELTKADRIVTISHALQEVLAEAGFSESLRVANGADVQAFRQPSEASLTALRHRYGLHDQFVLAYIGNHGWWAGMEFLLESFLAFQAQVPNSRLLIVGPGEEIPTYRDTYASQESIIFTGPVPPTEVTDYFHLSALGLLPFDLCPFTHHALPLKVLEYGAARKPVLASPLKELQTLQFPHVELLPLEKERWVQAFLQAATHPPVWSPEWDKTVEAYDWAALLQPLHQLIQADLERRAR